MIESLKPYLQVASALSEITRDRAREVARHAFAATPTAGALPGAATVETVAGQIGALADELVSTSRANRAVLTDLVRTEVESVLSRMGLTQHAELQAQLAATNARVRELERELAVRDAQEVGAEVPPPPPPAPAIRRDSVEEDAEAAARQAVVKRAATKKAVTKKAATKRAAAKKTTAKKTTAPQGADETSPEPLTGTASDVADTAAEQAPGSTDVAEQAPGSTDVAGAPAAKRAPRKSAARKTSAATEEGAAGTARKGTAKKSASKTTTAKTTTAKKSSARQPGARRSGTSPAVGQSPLPSVDAAAGNSDGAP